MDPALSVRKQALTSLNSLTIDAPTCSILHRSVSLDTNKLLRSEISEVVQLCVCVYMLDPNLVRIQTSGIYVAFWTFTLLVYFITWGIRHTVQYM